MHHTPNNHFTQHSLRPLTRTPLNPPTPDPLRRQLSGWHEQSFSPPSHSRQQPASLSSWTLAGSLDPSTGIFYRTPENPRLRTAQACEKCRTRKAKCSGEHPTCNRCLTRGLICEYAKEGRLRGPNRPKIKDQPAAASAIDDSHAVSHKRIASAPHRTSRLYPDSPPTFLTPDDDGKRRSLPLSFPSLSQPADPTPPSRDHSAGRIRPPALVLEKISSHHIGPSDPYHGSKPIPGLNAALKFQQGEMSPVNRPQMYYTYPEPGQPHTNPEHSARQIPTMQPAVATAGNGTQFKEEDVPLYYPFPDTLRQPIHTYPDILPSVYSSAHSDTLSNSHDSSPTAATHSSPTTPLSQTEFYHENEEGMLVYPPANAYIPNDSEKSWTGLQVRGTEQQSAADRMNWGNFVGGDAGVGVGVGVGEYTRMDENDRSLVDGGYSIELRM